jgi:DNA-binding transcriptional ArsR family regulator
MVEHSEPILDATYHALSHPARRQILARLQEGNARVTELASAFSISLAAVSKHIVVLEDAGLLRRTVSGRDHLLAIDAGPMAAAAAWLEAYRDFWEGRLDSLERLLGEHGAE